MKTLKSIMLGLVLLAATITANAAPINEDISSQNYAVTTFINAITKGKVDDLSNVLDKTMSFNVLRGQAVRTFSKDELLGYLQNDKGVKLNCITSTSVVESNAKLEVVKVDIKSHGLTRSNLLTLANTANGWKIVNIYTMYV
jgi:hypothetical protein